MKTNAIIAQLLILQLLRGVYGVHVGSFYVVDTVRYLSQDGGGEMQLPSPFWYFGANYTTAFVYANGVISLGQPLSTNFPSLEAIDRAIIAPFWTNNETMGISVSFAVSNDTDLLERAELEIGTDGVSHLFIITWSGLPIGGLEESEQLGNTLIFQTVLVLSDSGRESHVMFHYGYEFIDDLGYAGSTYAVVGFSAGDGVHSLILPTSGTEQVLQVTEFRTWLFRVGGEDVTVQGTTVIVGFEQTEYTFPEPTGPHAFVELCIRVLGSTPQTSVTMIVNQHDGTATKNSDYSSRPRLSFFLSSSESSDERMCGNILLLGDDRVEYDETFSITLDPSLYVDNLAFLPRTVSITIVDDDTVLLTHVEPTLIAMEGGGNVGDASPYLFCARLGSADSVSAPQRPISASFSLVPGTATENVDYIVPTVTRLFFGYSEDGDGDGEVNNIACSEVTILNDDVYEGEEDMFHYVLESEDPDVIVDTSLGTVVIMDDVEDGENVRLGLDQTTYTAVEGQDKIACLNLAQGNFQYPMTFTIRIQGASFFTEGYRAQNPQDLIFLQQPVTFYPGNTTSRCVAIRAQLDNLYEGPEFAQIRVDKPKHVIIDPLFAPIEITDINDVEIALPTSDYVYDENALSVQICANLTGDIERDLRIRLRLEEGTATFYDPHGSRLGDVFRNPSPITFRQSNRLSNIACTDISLHDDSFLEPEVETFTVHLQNSDPGVEITTRSITVSLLDDDHVNLRFTRQEVEIDEDVGKLPNVICIEREGISELNITVQLVPIEGTAINGSDFLAKDDSFFIEASYYSPKTVCASINLTIIDDQFVEGHETFSLQLMSDNPEKIRVRDPFTNLLLTLRITIRDNDVVSVNFTKVQFSVSEGDGGVDVCLQMTGLTFQTTDFIIKTRPLSAIDGVDFVSQTLSISFPAANESEVNAAILNDPNSISSLSGGIQCARVTIIDDDMLELENSKTFSLVLHTDEEFAKLVNPTSAIVTIIDDDVVTLNLEETQITVNEGDGTAEICITIAGQAEFPINTTIRTTDGSAIAMYDYGRLSAGTVVTFPAYATSKQCTSVEIVDNTVVEEREQYFSLFLDVDVSNPSVIVGENSTTMVTIIDDDVVNVGFESDEYSPLEGDGMVTVCAYLKGLMDISVTVIASTQPINSDKILAQVNIDYEPVSDLLVFGEPSDQSNQTYCFDITIQDDMILEDTETFQVILESSDPGVHLEQERTNVYVLDNDGVRMGLSEREYFSSEPDGFVPICVELVGMIEQNIVVALNTISGSAQADSDFETVHVNLTFASSNTEEQSICTNVPLMDDPLLEDVETFFVSVVIRNEAVSIHIQEAMVYLSDDDRAEMTLTRGGMVVNENVGDVVICVDLVGQSERNVSYVLETTSRTGQEEQDYSLSPNPSILFFPPSNNHRQQQCTPITIFDDAILENSEHFSVNLSTAVPRVSIQIQSTFIEIEDNDVVTVGFDTIERVVNEDEQPELEIPQCVELTGETERPIVVGVSTVERNATAEEDFVPIRNELLTFEPYGDKTLCTVVVVHGDRLVERVEHFDLTLSTSDPAVVLNPDRIVITITDEDVVCLSEARDSSRGYYEWPETFPNEMAVLVCKEGEKSATRFCRENGVWENPIVTNCDVSTDAIFEYIDRNEFTKENLRELLFALTQIGTNDEEIAQKYMITLTNVFEEMASLVESDELLMDTETFGVVLEIVDELQEWPSNVLRNYSSRVVKSMETITTGYVKFENITEPFDASTFDLNTLGFYAKEGELKDVFKRDKNISVSFVKQLNRVQATNTTTSSSLSTITLPPSLVDTLSNLEEVGLFFSHYNSSAFFPLVLNNTRQDSTDCKGTGNETVDAACVSSVISATVSRESVSNLQDNVTFGIDITDLKINYTNRNVTKSCVAWDFKAADGKGNWTDKGCVLIEESDGRVVCSCNHLTNFAVLVNIEARTGDGGLSEPVTFALEIISIVGVCMSLLGLALTIITLIVFNKLRKRDSTKFRVQLCVAMFMMLLVFICGIDRTEITPICVTISGLIHYFTLVTMMWTAAEALLMFQKLIIVFTQITTRYLVIVSLVCWLLPIPAVIIPIAIDRSFAIHEEFCFISHSIVFFAAFLGPIGAIICFNFIIFIMVIVVLVKHTTKRYKKSKQTSKFGVTIRTMLSITGVMTIFGLTWLFGAFTVSSASETFSFLFVIFNSLQGFFIFIFFVVLAKETRELWMQACGCKKKKDKSSTLTSTLNSHSSSSMIRRTQMRPPLQRRTSQLSFDIENAERLKVLEAINPEIRMRMNSWDVMYIMPQNHFDVLLYSKTITEEEIKETDESQQPKMVLVGTNPTQRKGSAENSSSDDSGIIIWMDNKSKCTPSPMHRQQQQQNSTGEPSSHNPHHVHSVSGLGYISGSSNSSTHSLPHAVELDNPENPVSITVSSSYPNGLSHSAPARVENDGAAATTQSCLSEKEEEIDVANQV